MLNFKLDIITISETKIQESTQPTFDVTLQNYNLYQTSTETNIRWNINICFQKIKFQNPQ